MTFSTILQACFENDACNFMHHCQNGACRHDPIFPLEFYPSIIYLLIPIACGLCNLSGNSMGMFKIMILMNLLRYNVGEATALIQALVIGAALPNFIEIIQQKHPNGKTSLVNYNLVMIFIPCCLYGSTIGALLQSILPQLIQDILIFIMFGYFSFNFLQKVRQQSPHKKQQTRESLITTEQSARQSLAIKDSITEKQNEHAIEGIIENERQQQQNSGVKNLPKKKTKKKTKKDPKIVKLRKQIKSYEKSKHLSEIGYTVVIFIVFQALSFFVQGQIPYLEFTKCTVYYPLGFIVLTLATMMFLVFLKKQMVYKFQQYKQVNFKVEIDLGDGKMFWKLVIGALGAGFVQGTLGVGAGTFLMAVLLASPLNPRVAAATSGYQLLFTGSAALTQQFINNKITVQDASFYFSWSAIGGGIITYILYRLIKRADQKRVKKILLWIITFLCISSLILILPVTIQRLIEQGWDYMMQHNFQC